MNRGVEMPPPACGSNAKRREVESLDISNSHQLYCMCHGGRCTYLGERAEACQAHASNSKVKPSSQRGFDSSCRGSFYFKGGPPHAHGYTQTLSVF